MQYHTQSQAWKSVYEFSDVYTHVLFAPNKLQNVSVTHKHHLYTFQPIVIPSDPAVFPTIVLTFFTMSRFFISGILYKIITGYTLLHLTFLLNRLFFEFNPCCFTLPQFIHLLLDSILSWEQGKTCLYVLISLDILVVSYLELL